MGFGHVAKALVALLERKRASLRENYGIEFQVTGIASRRLGWLAAPRGFCTEKLLAGDFGDAWPVATVEDWLTQCRADALFECTSLNAATGEPAISYIRAALNAGAHAFSANKGPVVHAYQELADLAAARHRKFYFESATMDGAPVFSLFRETLPALEIRGFRGILNSTTTVILEAMEEGLSFEAATARAQSLGVAETDPSDDIMGVDAAVKVAALTTVLMKTKLRLDQIHRRGVADIGPEDLREARQNGAAWRLVGEARRERNGEISASVAPQRLEADDPLRIATGTSLLISFETDVFPELIVGERNPGPEATAYGLMADFLNATRSS